MASPQASDKLGSNLAVTMYDFDPDGTDPTDVAWVDMRDFENFMAVAMHSVGTGTVASFKIIANSQSDGSGTDVEIKTHALGSAPDAVGDTVVLECTAEEIAQEAADANETGVRYVSAQLDLGTGTDEFVVTYIRGGAKRAYDGLTSDSIA